MPKLTAVPGMLFAAILCLPPGPSARAAETPPGAGASDAARPESVRVAGIVLKWLRMDKEANFRRGEKLIREAAAGGARIVVTTEGFLDGYMIEDCTFPEVVRRTCDAGADFVVFLSGGVFGPGNNRTIQARARENDRTMIFVHPAQFLVVAPDGTIVEDEVIGGRGEHPPENWFRNEIFNCHSLARGMLIGTEQIGTDVDKNGVVYFDLPLTRERPAARQE